MDFVYSNTRNEIHETKYTKSISYIHATIEIRMVGYLSISSPLHHQQTKHNNVRFTIQLSTVGCATVVLSCLVPGSLCQRKKGLGWNLGPSLVWLFRFVYPLDFSPLALHSRQLSQRFLLPFIPQTRQDSILKIFGFGIPKCPTDKLSKPRWQTNQSLTDGLGLALLILWMFWNFLTNKHLFRGQLWYVHESQKLAISLLTSLISFRLFTIHQSFQ